MYDFWVVYCACSISNQNSWTIHGGNTGMVLQSSFTYGSLVLRCQSDKGHRAALNNESASWYDRPSCMLRYGQLVMWWPSALLHAIKGHSIASSRLRMWRDWHPNFWYSRNCPLQIRLAFESDGACSFWQPAGASCLPIQLWFPGLISSSSLHYISSRGAACLLAKARRETLVTVADSRWLARGTKMKVKIGQIHTVF